MCQGFEEGHPMFYIHGYNLNGYLLFKSVHAKIYGFKERPGLYHHGSKNLIFDGMRFPTDNMELAEVTPKYLSYGDLVLFHPQTQQFCKDKYVIF